MVTDNNLYPGFTTMLSLTVSSVNSTSSSNNSFSLNDCNYLFPVAKVKVISNAKRHAIFGLLSIIPVLGLFGNALVIVTYVKFHVLRTKCNIFVLSLAIADICVCVLVVPLRLYELINHGEWNLGRSLCDVVNILDIVLITVSILSLACLAFERYLVICHNFLYRRLNRKRVVLLVLLCWCSPIMIFCLPMALKWHIIGIEDLSYCFSTSPSRCPLLVNAAFGAVSTIISFHVPLIVMVICYWKILMATKQHAKAVRGFSVRLDRHRSKLLVESKAARTLGIVMGCFCVCWLPFSVTTTVLALSSYSFASPQYLDLIILWLGYANSCMNPLLYYVFSRDFKVAYKKMFHCCSF